MTEERKDQIGKLFLLNDVAIPYLNGMFIDIMGMDDWAKDAVKDIDPFYKKKIFGLF